MTKIMQVIEDNNEGLTALLGKHVLITAFRYIYTGVLTGVNDTCILLTEAKLVFETGPFTTAGYKDAQPLPGGKVYVQRNAIESFGGGK